MPRYTLHYAYDITCYKLFSMEAKSPKSAIKAARRLLDAGAFEHVKAGVYVEAVDNHRIPAFAEEPRDPSTLAPDISELEGIKLPDALRQPGQ